MTPLCTQARIEREEKVGNTFTIMNSFWFIAASLLGQGVDVLPRYIPRCCGKRLYNVVFASIAVPPSQR
jgi:hypothetical protein